MIVVDVDEDDDLTREVAALGLLHARRHVVDGYPDLPLCWVASDPVDDPDLWAISFDHNTLPAYALVTTEQPTCSSCLEWVHA